MGYINVTQPFFFAQNIKKSLFRYVIIILQGDRRVSLEIC